MEAMEVEAMGVDDDEVGERWRWRRCGADAMGVEEMEVETMEVETMEVEAMEVETMEVETMEVAGDGGGDRWKS